MIPDIKVNKYLGSFFGSMCFDLRQPSSFMCPNMILAVSDIQNCLYCMFVSNS